MKKIKFEKVSQLCNELMTTYYFDNFDIDYKTYDTDDLPERIKKIGDSQTIDEFIYYVQDFNSTLKRRKADYKIEI